MMIYILVYYKQTNLSNLHTLGEEIMRNPELSKIHPTSHKE